jgi:phosphatidylglycerophosphate synthase
MKYSFRSLIASNIQGLSFFDLYLKVFICPPAMLLAWMLLNYTRVTANQLTFIGLFLGVSGSVCGFFFGLQYLVIGFYTAMICDFADGSLARNGRGSGETGIFLDMIVDRAVLCAACVCVLAHHLQLKQLVSSWLLVVYVLAYLYGDIICYGLHIAKTRTGGALTRPKVSGDHKFISFFLNPAYLIPSRLSSPLWIVVVKYTWGDFVAAYAVGVLIVMLEYAREGARLRS